MLLELGLGQKLRVGAAGAWKKVREIFLDASWRSLIGCKFLMLLPDWLNISSFIAL